MNVDREARARAICGRIGIDANAAVEALDMIADSFETGKMPPQPLVAYLASSLRRALAEPSAERATTLLFELGMTAPAKEGRKPKHIDYHVMRSIVESETAANADVSEAHLNRMVAKRFDVSAITARKHVKPVLFIPKLLKANQLGSLVRIRRPKHAKRTDQNRDR